MGAWDNPLLLSGLGSPALSAYPVKEAPEGSCERGRATQNLSRISLRVVTVHLHSYQVKGGNLFVTTLSPN